MIYKSLSTLPMITYVEISESKDVNLLDPENKLNETELSALWEQLKEEYATRYAAKESKKQLRTVKELGFLKSKYITIKMCLEALKFDANPIILDIMQQHGYRIKMETYLDDLGRINLECEAILLKLKELQNKLPSEDEKTGVRDSVLNAMSSYSTVLGFDFDYYTISVEKFYLLGQSATNKLKPPTE